MQFGQSKLQQEGKHVVEHVDAHFKAWLARNKDKVEPAVLAMMADTHEVSLEYIKGILNLE